ncbi:cutinase family protein [Gordonia terrae]|uniref:cutinase family protein n=1 Tax=Gordonia terrae TaxID=2055 RepID=UPI0021512955|nr:cutinase family protein [Gordonia terrae]
MTRRSGAASIALAVIVPVLLTGAPLGAGTASARVDCKDVFVLAVPGTWETNAKARRDVVPGMLSKVTNPVRAAVERGTPIVGPEAAPVQIGQEQNGAPSSGGAVSSLVGGLLDTAGQMSSQSSPTLPDGQQLPGTTSPTGSLPTIQPASDRDQVKPRIQLVDDTPTTSAPAPSDEDGSGSSVPSGSASVDGGAIGKSVGFEQIPYVAQVGGPIAGVVKNDPLTLGQSRANGTAALKARLAELSKACPSAKFAGLGYSQGSLVLGDVFSEIGNGRGPVSADRILAGGLLSDPARTPTTANLDSEAPAPTPQVLPGSETFVGPNVAGQGAVGARPDGFGTLADRVTSFCAEGDAICALTGKSKAIQAVVPLLNLRSQDIGPYVSGRMKTLLTNVASANPEDINRAVVSVINAATQIGVAGATNPYAIPLELARVVFASSMLDDIGRVVRMPEYDAFLSLVKPDEFATQVVQVASYSLLGVHQAYDRRPVNAQGDTATVFLAKWLLGRIEAS